MDLLSLGGITLEFTAIFIPNMRYCLEKYPIYQQENLQTLTVKLTKHVRVTYNRPRSASETVSPSPMMK
jgi:hypothetical protein